MSMTQPAVRRSVPGLALASILLPMLFACSSDVATAPPRTDASSIYFRMRANHRAVTLGSMAPYDTLQLRAIAYAADGSVLPTTVTPVFRINDSSAIRVTPRGVIRAAATNGVAEVVVALTIDGVTLEDTVVVSIYPSAVLPNIASAMIVRMDSAKRASGQVTIRTEVKDSVGAIINGIPVRVWLPDTTHMKFARETSRLRFTGGQVGADMLYSSATVFGRELRDSVLWRVGYSLGRTTYLQPSVVGLGREPAWNLNPQPVYMLGVGGTLTWVVRDTTEFDVVFDDTTGIASTPTSPDGVGGNIAPFMGGYAPPFGVVRARRFNRPGTYQFSSTRKPTVTGRVVVVDERACLPDCPTAP